MTKYPYKAIEDAWGNIFIIKAGLRQVKFKTFSTIELAKAKCDELNEANKND